MNPNGRMPLAFSIILVKVLILVKAFINFQPKLEDAFSVFNMFSKSIDFSKEVSAFLAKVVILVRRSVIFSKKLRF